MTDEQRDKLERIGERYLAALQSGGQPDIEGMVSTHPEIAGALRKRLEVIDRIHRMARGTSRFERESEGTRDGAANAVDPGTARPERAEEMPESIGRFRVTGILGEGVFGRVFRAVDEELGRDVAIKVPRLSTLVSQVAHGRFLREARSAARLTHPSIVPVYEVGLDRDVPFIVSELVEGVPLDRYLEGRRLEFREAARLVSRLADAVAFAHHEGVTHRDIKPGNIVIDDAGDPHITDFGLARLDEEDGATVTLEGQLVGTPAYMAPEQARGERSVVGHTSDIYSLGVVLYEILAGERPFRGSKTAVIQQVLCSEPRRPRSFDLRIPVDLETICLKAMAKESRRRYDSARDLAADLDHFLRGEPIRARPVGALGRLWLWSRRNRVVALLIAIVSCLLITVMVGSIVAAIVFRQKSEEAEMLASKERDAALGMRQALDAKEHALAQKVAALSEREVALRESEGNRLTAQSTAVLPENPGLALLLAIEGARRAPGFTADNALRGALASLREYRCFQSGYPVHGVSFSPDGRLVAAGSWDGLTRIWDHQARREVMVLIGHDAAIIGVDFRPDGSRVVTSSWDGTVRVWEVSTGRQLVTFSSHRRGRRVFIESVRFSPDGSRIVTACRDDRTARIFDVEAGTSVILRHEDRVQSAFFSSDGATVLTCSPRALRLWDARDGTSTDDIPAGDYKFVSATLGPAGARVAASCTDDCVRIWESFDGEPSHVIRTDVGRLKRVSFGPTGRRVIVWGSRETRILDAWTGKDLAYLRGQQGRIGSAEFSKDGQFVVTSAHDGTTRVWKASAEIVSGEVRPAATGSTRAFSPDGAMVITAEENRRARIRDTATWRPLVDLVGHTDDVSFASFSPVGSLAVTSSWDHTARIWDPVTGEERQVLKGHGGPVLTAVFDSDGSRVLTASHDLTARMWDVSTGECLRVFKGHRNWLLSASFAPSGDRVVTSAIDGVRVWDARTGEKRARIDQLEWSVSWAGFSPDGARVIAGILVRNSAVIVDAETGDDRVTLRGHDGVIELAEFSSDGARVLTVSEDATVRVWRTADGRELATLRSPEGPFRYAMFSEDGRHVFTVTAGGSVRIWPLEPLTIALERKPRELTPEELDQYGIGTEEERRDFRDAWERERRLEHLGAHESAARMDPHNWEKWWALARLHARDRDYGRALVCLERAIRLPKAPRGLRRRLADFRKRVLPDLVSYASIDAAFDSDAAGATLLKEFKAHVAATGARDAREHHLAYLAGRELQREGKPEEARVRFEDAVARDSTRPEPVLRISECLSALGDAAAAESRVRKALDAGVEESDLLWDAWFTLNVIELGRGARQALELAPRGHENGPPSSRRADLIWILEGLAERRAIRINCGGKAFAASDGEAWGRDRFFTGGYRYFGDELGAAQGPFTEDIRGTDDDGLYQTERWFNRGIIPAPGYRIPLPAGDYRVVLHFAEIFPVNPGGRVFDVRLEGKTVLEKYEALRAGFATAERKVFEIGVRDGYLDVEVVPRSSEPKISAIEIVPSE